MFHQCFCVESWPSIVRQKQLESRSIYMAALKFALHASAPTLRLLHICLYDTCRASNSFLLDCSILYSFTRNGSKIMMHIDSSVKFEYVVHLCLNLNSNQHS